MITFGKQVSLEDYSTPEDNQKAWLEINNGDHHAAALVVTHFSGDIEPTKSCVDFAKLLVNAENLANALECLSELCDAAGVPRGYARRQADFVLREIGRLK